PAPRWLNPLFVAPSQSLPGEGLAVRRPLPSPVPADPTRGESLMRRFRSLLVVAVALAFAVAVQQTARADDKAADKAGKKAGKGGKKKGHAVHGTVIAVKKDKDKDEGTITVRVHHRRKKGDATASKPVEKVFKVTSATKFQKVSGTRGDRQLTSATF